MSDKQTLIESIENGNGRSVRIHLQTFKGKLYIDIRTWIEGDDGEWKATQKGLCLSTELLPALIQALTKADESMEGKA
jgi:hypothetical protein